MKTLICVLITISTSAVILGQQNKFDIGLEGGPSMTILRGSEMLESMNDPKLSYSGGLFFQYNFPKLISIRTNLAFERKGAVATGTFRYLNSNLANDFTTNTNFEYLTLPILVRAGLGNKTKFFMNAGPYFSYLMKQTFVTEGPNIPKTHVDNTINCKRFDMGITAGLGLAIKVKEKFSLSCEIRNNLGLYNVSEVPVNNNGTIKTNSSSFLIGLAYHLGTRVSEQK